MQSNKTTRLLAITGATLALVIASTAAVAAHGPRDDTRGFGRGGGMGMDRWQGDTEMPGMRGWMRSGFHRAVSDFERRETTIQTAEGTTSYRVERGVVDATSDAVIALTLASGETVSVGMDDDTDVVRFEERTVTQRGWSRTRLLPIVVEPGDIEAGAEVMVWSTSEDGGDFLASRVVIQPADDEIVDDGSDDSADPAAAVEEAEAGAAASTDA
jgi:hypothetical protein